MKFIKDLKEGDRVSDIYLCKHKQSAVTKNGKAYDNVILQDKTGTIDGKIWDPNSAGIGEFESLDCIEVFGEVTSFQSALQVNMKRVRLCREGEYNPADYLPVSGNSIEEMYGELLTIIDSVKNPYLKELLNSFFRKDETGKNNIMFVINMTPMMWENYMIGVPKKKKYKLLLNSDDKRFGGNGHEIPAEINAVRGDCNFKKYNISFDLPPYTAAVFVF